MVAAISLVFALNTHAQETDDSPGANNATTTIFIARTSQQLDSPYVRTYDYVELLQRRGRWICPDLGYIDFGRGDYREIFVGGGRSLHDSKRATLIEELYFVQASGPAAKGAKYLWPWTMLQLQFTPKLTSESVYFPYVPLNSSARIQHVLERSKLEYVLSEHWKVGAGYGGYKYGGSDWQHKPFLTATVSTRAGAFEFWLQRMPSGAQVQLRYALVHISNR